MEIKTTCTIVFMRCYRPYHGNDALYIVPTREPWWL